MLHMEMVHVSCGVGGCVDILGGDILPMHTMCTYPFSSHTIPRCIHLVGGVLAGTGGPHQQTKLLGSVSSRYPDHRTP